jgi:hypothetical protein
MTTGSSIQAITLTAPPQARQISMSMLNTRLSRYAQVIDDRRSMVVLGTSVERKFNEMTVFLY